MPSSIIPMPVHFRSSKKQQTMYKSHHIHNSTFKDLCTVSTKLLCYLKMFLLSFKSLRHLSPAYHSNQQQPSISGITPIILTPAAALPSATEALFSNFLSTSLHLTFLLQNTHCTHLFDCTNISALKFVAFVKCYLTTFSFGI